MFLVLPNHLWHCLLHPQNNRNTHVQPLPMRNLRIREPKTVFGKNLSQNFPDFSHVCNDSPPTCETERMRVERGTFILKYSIYE